MANIALIRGERRAAGPVVPLGTIAAAGFEKGLGRIQKIQQSEFEKRKLEAQALAKNNQDTEKILNNLYKNQSKVKVNNELLQGYWSQTNLATAALIKQNQYDLYKAVKSGKLTQFEAYTAQDQVVNNPLQQAVDRADKYREFYTAANNIKENISSSVSADVVGKVNGILSGDQNIIFSVAKELDVDPDDLLNPDTLQKLGYVSADTTGINTLFDATQQAAQSAAQKGLDKNGYMQSVKQNLSQLQLSDNQYISAAFDFLGKETPGYVNPFDSYIKEDMKVALETKNINAIQDTDGDGNPMNEIKSFVNDAMIKAAEDSYEAFKKDYADKFIPDTPDKDKNIKLNAEEYAEELNNAMSNYDFSMFNNMTIFNKLITGSEIRNGKLYLEYSAGIGPEGQKILEFEGIDLNNKARLKSLLSQYIKKEKGLSLTNKIMNNITDEMLFTIDDINKQNSILFPSPTTKPNLP